MKKHTYTLKAFCVILLIAFVASPGHINAQKRKKKKPESNRDDSWDYTIVRNSPADISPYTVSFYPLIMEVSGLPGSGLGAEASLNYQVNDNIEAFGAFNYNYLTISISDKDFTYQPVMASGNFGIELAGTWFFSNETKHKTEEVLLYSEPTGYRSYISHYTKIDLDHQQKFGLRAGFNYLNYITGDLDADKFQADNLVNPSISRFLGRSILTNGHTGIFAIGLASEKVHDYKLTFKNGAVRNISRKMSWHLDFLANLFTTFDNVHSMDSTFDLNKFTPKSSFGARIGFESQSLSPFGGNFGFDFGIVPGAPNQLLFMAFKYGMAFNKKLTEKE